MELNLFLLNKKIQEIKNILIKLNIPFNIIIKSLKEYCDYLYQYYPLEIKEKYQDYTLPECIVDILKKNSTKDSFEYEINDEIISNIISSSKFINEDIDIIITDILNYIIQKNDEEIIINTRDLIYSNDRINEFIKILSLNYKLSITNYFQISEEYKESFFSKLKIKYKELAKNFITEFINLYYKTFPLKSDFLTTGTKALDFFIQNKKISSYHTVKYFLTFKKNIPNNDIKNIVSKDFNPNQKLFENIYKILLILAYKGLNLNKLNSFYPYIKEFCINNYFDSFDILAKKTLIHLGFFSDYSINEIHDYFLSKLKFIEILTEKEKNFYNNILNILSILLSYFCTTEQEYINKLEKSYNLLLEEVSIVNILNDLKLDLSNKKFFLLDKYIFRLKDVINVNKYINLIKFIFKLSIDFKAEDNIEDILEFLVPFFINTEKINYITALELSLGINLKFNIDNLNLSQTISFLTIFYIFYQKTKNSLYSIQLAEKYFKDYSLLVTEKELFFEDSIRDLSIDRSFKNFEEQYIYKIIRNCLIFLSSNLDKESYNLTKIYLDIRKNYGYTTNKFYELLKQYINENYYKTNIDYIIKFLKNYNSLTEIDFIKCYSIAIGSILLNIITDSEIINNIINYFNSQYKISIQKLKNIINYSIENSLKNPYSLLSQTEALKIPNIKNFLYNLCLGAIKAGAGEELIFKLIKNVLEYEKENNNLITDTFEDKLDRYATDVNLLLLNILEILLNDLYTINKVSLFSQENIELIISNIIKIYDRIIDTDYLIQFLGYLIALLVNDNCNLMKLNEFFVEIKLTTRNKPADLDDIEKTKELIKINLNKKFIIPDDVKNIILNSVYCMQIDKFIGLKTSNFLCFLWAEIYKQYKKLDLILIKPKLIKQYDEVFINDLFEVLLETPNIKEQILGLAVGIVAKHFFDLNISLALVRKYMKHINSIYLECFLNLNSINKKLEYYKLEVLNKKFNEDFNCSLENILSEVVIGFLKQASYLNICLFFEHLLPLFNSLFYYFYLLQLQEIIELNNINIYENIITIPNEQIDIIKDKQGYIYIDNIYFKIKNIENNNIYLYNVINTTSSNCLFYVKKEEFKEYSSLYETDKEYLKKLLIKSIIKEFPLISELELSNLVTDYFYINENPKVFLHILGIYLCCKILNKDFINPINNYLLEIKKSISGRKIFVDKTGNVLSTLKFISPCKNPTVINTYGFKSDKTFHSGIDLVSPYYEVYAIESGVVEDIGYNQYLGNYIKIKHNKSFTSLYGHLSIINVSANTFIEKGNIIGYIGKTGYTFLEHLHFEICKDSVFLNPLIVLPL